MALNTVQNNAPAGHSNAAYIDTTVSELNTPAPKAPPGSIGHQLNGIKSELVAGNLGGVGVPFGVGLGVDAGA